MVSSEYLNDRASNKSELQGVEKHFPLTRRCKLNYKEQTNTLRSATRYLVEVPFLTSHIAHLKASAPFLYVQTLQSQ